MGCENYLLSRLAVSCIVVSEQTKGFDTMDMHNGTQVRETADHHDDVVAFGRATPARKTEAAKTVATTCGEGWYHDAAIAAAEQDAIEARGNPYHP